MHQLVLTKVTQLTIRKHVVNRRRTQWQKLLQLKQWLRKTRLVLDLIRGKNVADAIAILKFTPNKAARIVEKTLNSAIANAENNFGLEKANLVVSETFANEGPTMKRFRPRAKGSASPINKRTTHVTVVVSEK